MGSALRAAERIVWPVAPGGTGATAFNGTDRYKAMADLLQELGTMVCPQRPGAQYFTEPVKEQQAPSDTPLRRACSAFETLKIMCRHDRKASGETPSKDLLLVHSYGINNDCRPSDPSFDVIRFQF